MKVSFIAILLLAGSLLAQFPAGSVEACALAVKADSGLVTKLVEDVKSGNIYQIFEDVMRGKGLLDQTKAACQGLDIKDILMYVYAHLNQKQKDCVTEVLGVVFAGQSVIADFQAHNWDELASDIQVIVSSIEGVREKCTAEIITVSLGKVRSLPQVARPIRKFRRE